MILDSVLSFHTKVCISILSGAVWIYFRTQQCYAMLPNHHILPVLFVSLWIYLNYYEPLFLPLGLVVLWLYSHFLNSPVNESPVVDTDKK